MKKKICIVTGSRAEYHLLYRLLKYIQKSSFLELQIIGTGMHLSHEYGYTIQDIESDGFHIDKKVDIQLASNTSQGITKSMGLGMMGCADALADLKPDIMLVLGDRYEIYAACIAAMIAKIPIAHLHGGEKTEGAFDEAIRHSITKMSHLHFVATEEYKQRVIQLGEEPNRVYCVGGLGVDSIRHTKLLNRNELEKEIDFKLGKRNLLVTFHPVTLEKNSELQMMELLAALAKLKDTKILFTMPNSDPEGMKLHKLIKNFCEQNNNASFHLSLGQLLYFSCVQHFDGVIGNSSSGLLEVPTFKRGTINIGDRQLGRLSADSVINCDSDRESISFALQKLFSDKFKSQLENVVNPYGNGGASKIILETLENIEVEKIIKKHFYDYSISNLKKI